MSNLEWLCPWLLVLQGYTDGEESTEGPIFTKRNAVQCIADCVHKKTPKEILEIGHILVRAEAVRWL